MTQRERERERETKVLKANCSWSLNSRCFSSTFAVFDPRWDLASLPKVYPDERKETERLKPRTSFSVST